MAKRSKVDEAFETFDEEAIVKIVGDEEASINRPTAARDYISTQSASLDFALGRPGIPVGAVTNIYGPEGSGKSTVSYHILSEAQLRGGYAVLYDSEGAFDRERAVRIGLDLDKLIMLETPTLEATFSAIHKIVESVSTHQPDKLIAIAIDSVAGSPAKAMLEGDYGDSHPAAQARAVSQAMPKLVPLIAKTKTALIFVGQNRAKMEFSPIPGQGAGKETQVAEGAIRYYSHVRIRFAQSGEVRDSKDADPTGIYTTGYVKKNKTAPPFRTARFVIDFLNGIDKIESALNVAQKIGLVQQRGGWFKYGEQSFRSVDFGKILSENPALVEAIEKAPLLWKEGLE